MKKNFINIALLCLFMFATCSIQNIHSFENDLNDLDLNQEEVVVIDNLSNVLVKDSNIFLIDNVTKNTFRVSKIESFDDQWAVTISKDYSNNCTSCRKPSCVNCRLCHWNGCYYYVKHCNPW